MANVQKYFEQFDEIIKLGRFKENEVLREKRDIVIDKLCSRLKTLFEEKGETPPTFTSFDQGSYAIGTGIKPATEGDYDIDEGVFFDISTVDYPDPTEVKKWVYDALFGHTSDVSIKRPCVTVQYQLEGEPAYHVDLAVYAHDGFDLETLYLARGRLGSPEDQKKWEISDPKGLCDAIDNRFGGDEAKQFRRIIRYLKRWRDVQFTSEGNAAPVGIGITVAAYKWFAPVQDPVDRFAGKYRDNDLRALRQFVGCMLSSFRHKHHDDEWVDRLEVTLPVQPYDDPFSRMTNRQMAAFRSKLERLKDMLVFAEGEEVDPVEACKRLQREFGDDFPVPSKDDTGKQKERAILTSSTSA